MSKVSSEQSSILRSLLKGAYDLQDIRIRLGGRVVANFKVKLGQAPSTKEEDLEEAEAKKLLADLRREYKRITDGIAKLKPNIVLSKDGIISTFAELVLISEYVTLEEREAAHFRDIETLLKDFPIYTEFLEPQLGCGPAMSGVIIAGFDIHRAKYASSLWKYAGYDVVRVEKEDGSHVMEGRKRKADHLIDVEYTNKEGKVMTKKSVTYSPWLKTKLYVLGTCFIRAKNPKYSAIYHNYKNRLENHEVHKLKTKGHRHAMAMRYMIKMFLQDLYVAWRTLEGLEVSQSYQEAKLGHVHRAA